MSEKIRYMHEIPTNIYSELPDYVYTIFKSQLYRLNDLSNKIKNNEIDLPKHKNQIITIQFKKKYYLYKEPDVPLDVTYCIKFNTLISHFNSILRAFFRNHDLDFDFELFKEKIDLLDYLSREIGKITELKLLIDFDVKYISFTAFVLLNTVNDTIILI